VDRAPQPRWRVTLGVTMSQLSEDLIFEYGGGGRSGVRMTGRWPVAAREKRPVMGITIVLLLFGATRPRVTQSV
jgi:hypothetical protein